MARLKSRVSDAVLDASALLAFVQSEPGSSRVAEILERGGAEIGAVNLSEVVAQSVLRGRPLSEVREELEKLNLHVLAFSEEDAYAAAALRPLTRHLGLSLADRACLALAQRLGVPALTTDRAWGSLRLGIDIQLIR
jgi:PIN domain nuclease of toxin-antitoxin system